MNATMHTTFKEKRNSMRGRKNKFDYKLFSRKLKEHKNETKQSYMEISIHTGIGMSLIVQIMNARYNSDLSINYASVLCEWMNDNLCNYLK
jgi:hypothetical protein